MAKAPLFSDEDDLGPYDGGAGSQDLWFLPADEELDPEAPPLPRADRSLLVDPRDWAAAQAGLSAELASLAALFGALDERLRAAPKGWRHRIALLEAAELSWWAGDRITADRLGLWAALRLAGVQDDNQGLIRAGWALRRLSGGPGPGGDGGSFAAFLGRHGQYDTVPDGIEDLAELSGTLCGLHPATRAAALFHGWRMLAGDEHHPSATREMEAAVVAARIGAAMGRGAALFLPLAISGVTGVRIGGTVAERLAQWLRGAERATLAALMHLDRVSAWAGRAGPLLADLQGRTPDLLLAAFVEWPMVTAPMAEQITGAARATAQRNLAAFENRGLIREVTGQGRYRIWTAML